MRARRGIDLRLRIAAVLATVCIAVVGGLCVALYLYSEEMQEAVEVQLVNDELESLIRRTAQETPPPSRGPNLQYYVLSAPADAEALPPALRELGPGHHQVGRGADEKRVAVHDQDGVRYIVVYNAGPHEARQAKFRNLLVFALATVVVVAVALGYWLAGVLTRQLRELAARVAELAPDRPHPPLVRPDHDREVAALARALDDYHARIVDLVEREQEFAANASHELRTPLTAIKTTCELLLAEPLPPHVRTRVESIERAAEHMTEYMRTLLLLARGNESSPPQAVPLRECVLDAAGAWRDELARKGVAFEVAIPPTTVVKANRNALQLVLANLIKNASRYTERGHVRVAYDAPRLSVTDTGPGIEARHLPHLFERYYLADNTNGGLGLGLAIVERVCDHFGWKIEVQSTPGEGSVFTLVLA